ncbi:MAG TPA: sulfotransferase [Mycobacteriales bacterium]|nr:sulfotransferase [Mycobacteriales bacterium]
MPPSQGVIVAGMHRSSTSLVASVFAQNGFWLAPDQLEAKPDNPKGYFEDAEIHRFHRQLLEHYDTAWDLSPRLRELREHVLTIPDELAPTAQALVDKYEQHRPWVWKNPRATLFLQEWARLFPDTTFVICVRSPAAVADSMLRRRDRMRISNHRRLARTRRVFRALSIWRSYNVMALRFVREQPDRCVVVGIPHDIAALQDGPEGQLFEPTLLRRPRLRVRIPAAFAFRCQLLHRQLLRHRNAAAALDVLGAHDSKDEGSIRIRNLIAVSAGIASSIATQLAVSAAS